MFLSNHIQYEWNDSLTNSNILFLANPVCRKVLTLRSVMLKLFPTEDCGVKRVGVVVVVVVVGNDRCLVEFDNLPPSPIRTAELPLPTFMPLGTVPLPVPILMPPSLMVPGGLPSTNNGDTTSERIQAVLMARNLLFEATRRRSTDNWFDRTLLLRAILTLRFHSKHGRILQHRDDAMRPHTLAFLP